MRVLGAVAAAITLFLALATGAYFGSLYAPDHKQYQTIGGNQASGADYGGPSKSLPDISGIPGFAERSIANPPPASGSDHEKRDLAAQEAMSVWAFWMMIVAAFSAVITTVGTIFLYKQIVLTREAVTDTGNATEAMVEGNRLALMRERAWVFVASVQVVPHRGGNVIRIIFKNYGQSPAPGFASDAVARNELYPFWPRPLEYASSDFAIMRLAPGQTHRREIRDFEVVGLERQRTRISISWSYRLPDNSVAQEFEDWIVVEQEGRFSVRQMLPIDSVNHPDNRDEK